MLKYFAMSGYARRCSFRVTVPRSLATQVLPNKITRIGEPSTDERCWPKSGDALTSVTICRRAHSVAKSRRADEAVSGKHSLGVRLPRNLGPLTESTQGHKYILVITDRFSKMVQEVPLRSITALTISKVVLRDWVFIYGQNNVVKRKEAHGKSVPERLQKSMSVEPIHHYIPIKNKVRAHTETAQIAAT